MRNRYPKVTSLFAFALLGLAACTSDAPPAVDAQHSESDVGHEDGHEHGELYEPHTPAPGADAAAVADAWLDAFTAGGTETAAWVSTLEGLCFQSYCDLLAQTDPSRIPTAAPTGAATAAATERADVAVATAPAEGGTWTVELLATAEGAWEVYSCTWESA
jgi:hypothetical protein